MGNSPTIASEQANVCQSVMVPDGMFSPYGQNPAYRKKPDFWPTANDDKMCGIVIHTCLGWDSLAQHRGGVGEGVFCW